MLVSLTCHKIGRSVVVVVLMELCNSNKSMVVVNCSKSVGDSYVSVLFQIWRKVKPMMDNYHSVQTIETRVFSPTTARLDGPPPKRRRYNSKTVK